MDTNHRAIEVEHCEVKVKRTLAIVAVLVILAIVIGAVLIIQMQAGYAGDRVLSDHNATMTAIIGK